MGVWLYVGFIILMGDAMQTQHYIHISDSSVYNALILVTS